MQVPVSVAAYHLTSGIRHNESEGDEREIVMQVPVSVAVYRLTSGIRHSESEKETRWRLQRTVSTSVATHSLTVGSHRKA